MRPAEKARRTHRNRRLEVGFVKVARDDAQEKWLVDSLLSMEQDLKAEEFASQPMMFVVFGRGRGLPPCVGKGINRDNLLDCVDFITGACSCTVKDQNPGMDLLFTMDWNAAAENIAKKFGFEEGNEYAMAPEDLFPQLMIPSGQPGQEAGAGGQPAAGPGAPAEAASTDPAAAGSERPATPPKDAETVAATKEPPQETQGPASSSSPGTTVQIAAHEAGPVPAGQTASPPGEPAKPPIAAAPAPAGDSGHGDSPTGSGHADAAAAPPPPPAAAPGVVPIAAGVVIALLVLFAATFFMLRPR